MSQSDLELTVTYSSFSGVKFVQIILRQVPGNLTRLLRYCLERIVRLIHRAFFIPCTHSSVVSVFEMKRLIY